MRTLSLILFLAISTCLWVQNAIANPHAAKISDLGDNLSVNQLAMVGSHNASTALEYGWFYGQQKSKVETQFAAGARFFKTPIHWYDPHKGVIGTIKKGVHFLTRKKENEPFIAL